MQADPEIRDPNDRIPTTVLTGFLGSGKTTLLNHLLTTNHGKRICIVENEFGEIDVDGKLAEDMENVEGDAVEVLNGCVCCTVRGDLSQALVRLFDNNRKAGKKKFDACIIETTGLADPAPVASTFFLFPEVAMRYKLDGIIGVVDAKHLGIHLDEKKEDGAINEAVAQVAFADRILLNKMDLVNEKEADEVVNRIRGLNGSAQIIKTEQSKCDPEKLMGIGCFSLEKALEDDPMFLTDPHADHEHEGGEHGHGHSHGGHGHGHEAEDCHDKACEEHGHGHGHGEKKETAHGHGHGHGEKKEAHGHGHGHGEKKTHTHDSAKHGHSHDSNVTSFGIQCEGEIVMNKFRMWIAELLDENKVNMYRTKGRLNIAGRDEKFVFQAVHEVAMANFADKWKDEEVRENRFCFIGRNLDKKELAAGFEKCIAEKLRFNVGDKIMCNTAEGWTKGEIIKKWDDGNPYRIKLDQADGLEVWGPQDNDRFVRSVGTEPEQSAQVAGS